MKVNNHWRQTKWQFVWLLPLILLLCTAANAQETIIQQQNERLSVFAERILPPDSKLAYKVVKQNFGPGKDLIVLLFRPKFSSSNYQGWILESSKNSANVFYKHILPPMNEIENHFDIAVNRVFFADINSDSVPELFVLYDYHRAGSQMDDGNSIYVYQVSAGKLIILEKAVEHLRRLKTEKAVRAKLKAAAKNPRLK